MHCTWQQTLPHLNFCLSWQLGATEGGEVWKADTPAEGQGVIGWTAGPRLQGRGVHVPRAQSVDGALRDVGEPNAVLGPAAPGQGLRY